MTVEVARKALTEREWQRQVTDLAKVYSWAIYHPWLSIHSAHGWPDIALCRPPRLILAELKAEKGKVSEAQEMWLDLLQRCPGIESYLWRPSDFSAVHETLR